MLFAVASAPVGAHPPQSTPRTAESQPAAVRPATPVVRVDSPLKDFGSIQPDSQMTAEFPIANVGTFDLEITQIEPAYGCSVVGEPPRTIPPGTARTLTLKLDPQALRGHFDKQVIIRCSDPVNPTLFLTLRGEMRRLIEVTPLAAGFGKIEPNDCRERVLVITNQAAEPAIITLDPPPDDARFVFQLVETLKGREYKLFVNTRPPYRTGTIRNEVVLRTNIAAQPEIRISAYAIIPADFEVSPAVIPLVPLNADPLLANAATTQIVQFNNFRDSDLRITAVTSSDPAVKTGVFEVQPGRRYRITVELPAKYRPPQSGAYITLITDDTNTPSIDVPIGQRMSIAQSPQRATSQPARTTATPKKPPALDLIGKSAPEISLKTLEETPVGNPEFALHPATVLNFFAPNCGFCKKQIPKVEELRSRYEPLNVRFVNVCETMRTPFTPDQVRAVMADLSANLEIAMDPGNRYGRNYKVTGFPVLFVVRGNGIVEHVVSGNKADLVEQVAGKLDALVSEAGEKPQAPAVTTQPAG